MVPGVLKNTGDFRTSSLTLEGEGTTFLLNLRISYPISDRMSHARRAGISTQNMCTSPIRSFPTESNKSDNILLYNSNEMHNSQSLFYLTTALHVSGVTITHLQQQHKTTVTIASGKRYTVIDRVKSTDKKSTDSLD
jgi:hypothetical protein